MKLTERVISKLEERRENILNGNINCIPSPFNRFSDDFIGIEQGKYYVVTSSTKVGKTQFSSFVFIYNTLLYAYKHPEQLDIKIFYYPLEETPEDIMQRFMCYIIYELSKGKIRINTTNLSSTKANMPVDEKIIDTLKNDEEYKNILQFFEDHIIFSSTTNPTGIYKECKRYAEENGVVYYDKVTVKDDLGQEKQVNKFNRYESNNPKEYRLIFIDHASLITIEKGMLSLKQAVDKLSEHCVTLRNRYNYTPILIQQQAFAGESLDAINSNKVRPTIANLSDSKYPSRDCNMCIGLFSPFKFELSQYMGYDITKFRDKIRFVEILINRGGSPGGIIALYFDGDVCTFKELPKPNDFENLDKIYKYIESLKSKPKISLLTISKLINYNVKLLYCIRRKWQW